MGVALRAQHPIIYAEAKHQWLLGANEYLSADRDFVRRTQAQGFV